MPSGKQSKRRRRAGQVPRPAAPRTRRQASPRVLLAVGAVLLALVAAGVLLGVVLRGGSSSATVPERGSLLDALPGATEVQQLLKGIPQRGNVLGSTSAPVTMVEYVDLQCPYCRQFDVEALPALISRYVRTGKLRVEERMVAFVGPDSERGRAAAIAAGRQNRLFNFVHLLYVNQGTENTGWLDDDMVQAVASSLPGLDVPQLLSERDSATVQGEESAVDEQASADNVTGTPTFLVGRTGSTLRRVELEAPTDVQPLTAAIDAALG